MKPYGVGKRDRMCCFGHSKYPNPKEVYSKPKNFDLHNRARKKRARQASKKECLI